MDEESGSKSQDDCSVTERKKAFSHDSTQLASDQRNNVLDPMKSKLRPVSVKTTVACSQNLVLFLILAFSCKHPFCNHKSICLHFYDKNFIWLYIGHFRRKNRFSFYSCPYITVYFLFQKLCVRWPPPKIN